MNDLALTKLFLFAKAPDFNNLDFVVTRDRVVDLRASDVSCLILVDDVQAKIGRMAMFTIGSVRRSDYASSPCGQCQRT